MGLDFKNIEIKSSNSDVLQSFIDSLDEEKQTFRYFETRDISIIRNHVYTCVLMFDDKPIGYGHLDKEDDIIWLGIVVKKNFQGQGASKRIMTLLINRARTLDINYIQLSVDKNNIKAIKLYRKYGFDIISETEHTSFLRKKVIKVGVSTLAFIGISKEEIVRRANDNNWIIEFSSSFPYHQDMVDFFNHLDISRFAHNYFPAPKDPFVMNLGSANDIIRQKSIAHCIQGIQMSKKANASFFSAHAGFCIDPNPEQLGQQLNVNVPISRSHNWTLFIESINSILVEAKKMDITFLIENNVTAQFNLRNDGQEVLFCSRPEEILKLHKEINSDFFGILLDTAHLKVSSKALNFGLVNAIEDIKHTVKYIHHSDNDGYKDTNGSIDRAYWFLPYIKYFEDCIHILEVKNIDSFEIENQIKLINEYRK